MIFVLQKRLKYYYIRTLLQIRVNFREWHIDNIGVHFPTSFAFVGLLFNLTLKLKITKI